MKLEGSFLFVRYRLYFSINSIFLSYILPYLKNCKMLFIQWYNIINYSPPKFRINSNIMTKKHGFLQAKNYYGFQSNFKFESIFIK